MAFITERESVYCALRIGEFLNEMHVNLSLKASCSGYEEERARPGNHSKKQYSFESVEER
jgi:hypothetical protein